MMDVISTGVVTTVMFMVISVLWNISPFTYTIITVYKASYPKDRDLHQCQSKNLILQSSINDCHDYPHVPLIATLKD
jgi:hypothetical protein